MIEIVVEPWDRQPKESAASFRAFVAYRDLPPAERSYALAAEKLGMKPTTVQRISGSHGWKGRIAAWDMEVDRRRLEGFLTEMQHVGARQARMVQSVTRALQQPAIELLRRIQANPATMEGWTDKQLLDFTMRFGYLLPQLVQTERLIAGDSTANIALRLEEPNVARSATSNEEPEENPEARLRRLINEDPDAASAATDLFARLEGVGAFDADGDGEAS